MSIDITMVDENSSDDCTLVVQEMLNVSPSKAIAIFRLQHALQALATDASTQITLYPAFVCVADELALTFDHWYRTVFDLMDSTLTINQQAHLQAIDQALAAMTHSNDQSLWTDQGLQYRDEWNHIRRLSQQSLASFGWPYESPPSYAHEYIPSHEPNGEKL